MGMKATLIFQADAKMLMNAIKTHALQMAFAAILLEDASVLAE
jgi:hypothetical protein